MLKYQILYHLYFSNMTTTNITITFYSDKNITYTATYHCMSKLNIISSITNAKIKNDNNKINVTPLINCFTKHLQNQIIYLICSSLLIMLQEIPSTKTSKSQNLVYLC